MRLLIAAAAAILLAAGFLFARPAPAAGPAGEGAFTAPPRAEARDLVEEARAEARGLVEEARAEARAGDVLFKSGDGFWGVMAARFSRENQGFGHVGLVVAGKDGALAVIHAGGDPMAGDGRVQAASLDDFLRRSTSAALYRPLLDEPALALVLAYAEGALARGAPFDAAFSLDTEEALYCTELVWRALTAAAGEDAAPRKTERVGRLFVAIDDLQASPLLERRWRAGE